MGTPNNLVWLVNLFGTPCTPTAFSPDNSLAALAGSLKAAGFQPRILDFQTVSMFGRLVPPAVGERTQEILAITRSRTLDQDSLARIRLLHEEILTQQMKVIDDIAEQMIADAKKERPLLIGLKMYSGEGSVFNLRLARRLRESLAIPLVAGGPLPRILGKRYFQMAGVFDFLLAGECDRSIVDFARFCLGKLPPEQVRGLIHRSPTGSVLENPLDLIEDLSALPDPCYDPEVYPAVHQKDEKILVFQLDESRGCPNNCHFCVHPGLNGRRFRIAPVEKILGQIRQLQSTFHAYGFRFAGSNTPKKFLRAFANGVLTQDLSIAYSCFASINTTDTSVIAPLKRSGMEGVFIGVESLDQSLLASTFNKRGQPRKKVEELVRGFIDQGIFTSTSWIYPAPFATAESRKDIKDFIIETYGGRSLEEGSVLVLPPAPAPGSEWFLNPAKFGFELGDPQRFFEGYANLIFKVYLPAQLMAMDWDIRLHGRSLSEHSRECDRLRSELAEAQVPLGMSDDWMLVGRLTGLSMKEFYAKVTHCFVSGDAAGMKAIIHSVNENSRHRIEAGERGWAHSAAA